MDWLTSVADGYAAPNCIGPGGRTGPALAGSREGRVGRRPSLSGAGGGGRLAGRRGSRSQALVGVPPGFSGPGCCLVPGGCCWCPHVATVAGM